MTSRPGGRIRMALALALRIAGSVLLGIFLGRAVRPSPSLPRTDALVFHEASTCGSCRSAVRIEGVEVQARQTGTLFVVRGTWPSKIGEISEAVRLVAGDIDIVLRPDGSANAFEIVKATRSARPLPQGSVAAGLMSGTLLVEIEGNMLHAPVRFAFGLWDGRSFTTQIPQTGLLVWDGNAAAPRPAH